MSISLLFAILIVIGFMISMVAVVSTNSPYWRAATAALFTAFILAAWLGSIELSGRPKPASFEWFLANATDATVLGSAAVENEAIYVWLLLDGVPEPRAYRLPWDKRAAEQLQEASRSAAEQQTALRMRMPFEPSLDDRESRFYAQPQPALPPKEVPHGAEVYRQPTAATGTTFYVVSGHSA